ncbi:MAG: CNNM domain-containing protein [Planctomycetota bacterium]|nr:CNNM domain-containing protein [Planctomycetota bacterium]
MIVLILSVLIALSVSFLCSLLEAVVLSVTPSQIAAISIKKPKLGAIWQGFKTHIQRPIALILVLNTAAFTIGATVAGAQFSEIFGHKWVWLYSLVLTFVMVQFTEILPKTLGVRFNRELAGVIAGPLNSVLKVLTPFLRLVHWINHPFEGKKGSSSFVATAEEIAAMAGLARLSNQISSHQERIIRGASHLARHKVYEVMIPVEQIAFLSTSQTLVEAVIAAHMDIHTRFPVCEKNDKNNVVGYVNFKEMIYFMRTNPQDPSFRGIIRPVHFAGPDESAADLLRVFVEQHIHIAIVRDKNGVTLGFVTLEDLVEELVGEIEDEFDKLPRMFHALSSGTWMVGGGVSMAEVAKGLNNPKLESTEKVSVWLSNALSRPPKPGDIYRQAGVEFAVRRVRRGQVFEVSVTQMPAT